MGPIVNADFLYSQSFAPELSKQQTKLPSYQPPEDPNYKCNFDRILEALTIKVTTEELSGLKLKEFFDGFMSVSLFGARVELLNEQTL